MDWCCGVPLGCYKGGIICVVDILSSWWCWVCCNCVTKAVDDVVFLLLPSCCILFCHDLYQVGDVYWYNRFLNVCRDSNYLWFAIVVGCLCFHLASLLSFYDVQDSLQSLVCLCLCLVVLLFVNLMHFLTI